MSNSHESWIKLTFWRFSFFSLDIFNSCFVLKIFKIIFWSRKNSGPRTRPFRTRHPPLVRESLKTRHKTAINFGSLSFESTVVNRGTFKLTNVDKWNKGLTFSSKKSLNIYGVYQFHNFHNIYGLSHQFLCIVPPSLADFK